MIKSGLLICFKSAITLQWFSYHLFSLHLVVNQITNIFSSKLYVCIKSAQLRAFHTSTHQSLFCCLRFHQVSTQSELTFSPDRENLCTTTARILYRTALRCIFACITLRDTFRKPARLGKSLYTLEIDTRHIRWSIRTRASSASRVYTSRALSLRPSG